MLQSDIAAERFIESNPQAILNVDIPDLDDQQSCAMYVKEIYAYLLTTERKYLLPPNFLAKQREITEEVRTATIDWASRIHTKFALANESFFHFQVLFDNVLNLAPVLLYDVKLVALACLLISSKFEQSYIPSLRHYVDVLAREPGVRYCSCDRCKFLLQQQGVYSLRPSCGFDGVERNSQAEQYAFIHLPVCQQCARSALIDCEAAILQLVDYNLQFPTSITFMRRYCKISDLKPRDRYIAFYIGELCCCSLLMQQYEQSLIAAACVAMTRRLTRKTSWCAELEQYSGYKEEQIKPVLAHVSSVLKLYAISPLTKNIQKKYQQQDRFYGVASLIENVVRQVMGV